VRYFHASQRYRRRWTNYRIPNDVFLLVFAGTEWREGDDWRASRVSQLLRS
jgi:hypothetical protein